MLTLATPYIIMYTLLDFNAPVFDKDNGAKGKIPVFRHEFHRISRNRLIGLLNDNKAYKLLNYIYILIPRR